MHWESRWLSGCSLCQGRLLSTASGVQRSSAVFLTSEAEDSVSPLEKTKNTLQLIAGEGANLKGRNCFKSGSLLKNLCRKCSV